VELEIVDGISHETVWQTLKKYHPYGGRQLNLLD
jgi:hypothetical protein